MSITKTYLYLSSFLLQYQNLIVIRWVKDIILLRNVISTMNATKFSSFGFQASKLVHRVMPLTPHQKHAL